MGRNWAIAIGINQYDNLKPLKYAKRDATAVRSFFRDEIQFERIYHFADDASEIPGDRGSFKAQPTYAALYRFLRVRFEQKDFLNPEDNFWFFFAGHGKRHKGVDYLIPCDADPGDVERTALSIRWIGDRLRRSGAGNVILLLDACRDEDDRGGQGIGMEVQQGMVSIFACSPEELSYEIEALQQGAFTHVLLEGLKIQGQGNCATVERLDQYLCYQVPMINQRYGKPRQRPYTVAEPMNKRHLILLPKQAEPTDLQALKLDAYEAERQGNLQEAQQLWRRVLVVNPSDRQALDILVEIWMRLRSLNDVARESVSLPSEARSDEPDAVAPSISEAIRERSPDLLAETLSIEPQPKTVQSKAYSEDLGNQVFLEMVLIPSGTFLMGSPDSEEGRSEDEGPQHEVVVPSFWIGKYPVTQLQWSTVAALPKIERELDSTPAHFKENNRPVEQVSWEDVIEFCQRLSKETGREYRLPSEAEWEYACRAGTRTPYHWGEEISTDLANFNSYYGDGLNTSSVGMTTSVGSYQLPNSFGLYDMHGNIWEWCDDYWHDNYQGAPLDGKVWINGGDSARRVLRGGSWFDSNKNCRSARRRATPLYNKDDHIGFRVVCTKY